MVGLIGLDWGTSSLRAYRLDEQGHVQETRHRPWGIRQLTSWGFETALLEITKEWPNLPRIACGMIGSRQGWHEVPYLELPANAAVLANNLYRLSTPDSGTLHLVPGLRNIHRADVMRGEETQVAGAVALHPELAESSEWVLPGTHSKWASVRNGRLIDFHTFMTGELYALLLRHSLLGAGSDGDTWSEEAFQRGVITARDSGAEGICGRLFSSRARLLVGELSGGEVAAYLSGMLIGEEFRANLAADRLRTNAPPRLIGEAALCDRYRQAARLFDLDLPAPLLDASAQGLWLLACHAGLVTTGMPLAPKESPSC